MKSLWLDGLLASWETDLPSCNSSTIFPSCHNESRHFKEAICSFDFEFLDGFCRISIWVNDYLRPREDPEANAI